MCLSKFSLVSNSGRYTMVAGLLKQSKQNAASLNFGRVPFPEGDLSDAEVLRSKRGAASKVAALEGSKQRKWSKRFGEQLDELNKHVADEKSQLTREAERAEEAGFEVAAASQAAWNEAGVGHHRPHFTHFTHFTHTHTFHTHTRGRRVIHVDEPLYRGDADHS